MTDSEGGKFCQQCTKTVYDFTLFSDEELIKRIQEGSGNMCGRFNASQLDRPILREEPSGRSVLKRFFAGLLLLGLGKAASANENIVRQEQVVSVDWNFKTQKNPEQQGNEVTISDSSKLTISGVVIDSVLQEPLIGVTIELKSATTDGYTLFFTYTDISGRFYFEIPDSLRSESIILSTSYVGYEKKQIIINLKSLKKSSISIELVEHVSCFFVGEIVVDKPKKWWQFWK